MVHKQVGRGVEEEPEAFGRKTGAGKRVCKQGVFQVLDAVFRITPPNKKNENFPDAAVQVSDGEAAVRLAFS